MPDGLTPEERRAIEAFPKDRVQRVPPGTTSWPGYRWDDQKNTLMPVEQRKPGWWFRGSNRGRPVKPEVAARRAKVRDLIQVGKAGAEIARELGVPAKAVYNDARALGMSFDPEATAAAKGGRLVKEGATKPQGDETRAAIRAAFDGKRTIREIAEIVGRSHKVVRLHLKDLGLTPPPGKPGGHTSDAVLERRAQIPALVAEGLSGPQIAERLGVSIATVGNDCKAEGITIPRGRRSPQGDTDKASDVRKARATKARAKLRDRRRFKTTPVPTGDLKRLAPADAAGTLFPGKVEPVGDEPVLKDGSMNSKIGGDVLVGRLKGAKIVTLTLEERATCPKHCGLWRACYGNGMPYSVRWQHGPDLEARLVEEVAELCAAHDLVLVRLHVLGDFYSTGYVEMWEALLDAHPGLHVFGFTAHPSGTEIGDLISDVRQSNPDRFMIRTSGRSGPWGSFTIDWPTERKQLGDAVVCPEQRESMAKDSDRHCGNCAVCWSSDVPVVFVEHG